MHDADSFVSHKVSGQKAKAVSLSGLTAFAMNGRLLTVE